MSTMLRLPHGMIVVTGRRKRQKINDDLATVLSIQLAHKQDDYDEDPVETSIPGINQSQAKTTMGCVAAAMRAFVAPRTRSHHGGEVRRLRRNAGTSRIRGTPDGHLVRPPRTPKRPDPPHVCRMTRPRTARASSSNRQMRAVIDQRWWAAVNAADKIEARTWQDPDVDDPRPVAALGFSGSAQTI